jgi:glycosyltransferase involved in cell wall biosynthesis
MSTFNGAAHLGEQLDSILAQGTPGPLQLLVRDDGSTDHTLELLTQRSDPRIELHEGRNLGVKASFLWLLERARSRTWDYLALADQDDVWLAGKLARAIERLGPSDRSSLYCSALQLVDARRAPLRRHVHRGRLGFEEGFLDNAATGCSCVLTRALLTELTAMPRAEAIHMHDWWLYLVALAFGRVVYDDEPHILHRQHDANVNGMPSGLRRIARVLRRRYSSQRRVSRARQAAEFSRLYAERLPEERRRYLELLANSDRGAAHRLRFALEAWPPSMLDAAGSISRLAFAAGIL